MHVAVAIVGFRNVTDISACLDALTASTHQDFEVVICENGGREACIALDKVLPRKLGGGQQVRLVSALGNLGFAGGVNLCLRASPDADAWWVLNPDTLPEPKALAGKVRVLEGGCDAVGCTLLRPDGSVQSRGGRWRRLIARGESLGIGEDATTPVNPKEIEAAQDYLNGAAMLVSRRFVEGNGLMREDYFLYCEEVEWFLRAQGRGLKLGFSPDAFVVHAQGATTGAGRGLRNAARLPTFLESRNRLLLTRDCFPAWLPLVAACTSLWVALRYARARAWTPLSQALAGLRAGLRNERGPPSWLSV